MCHSSKPAATAKKLQTKKLKVKNIQSVNSEEHSVRISYISGLVGGFCGAYRMF